MGSRVWDGLGRAVVRESVHLAGLLADPGDVPARGRSGYATRQRRRLNTSDSAGRANRMDQYARLP